MRATVWVLLLASLAAGCFVGAPASRVDTGGWEKNWLETTCEDWHQRMAPGARIAFARSSLNASRQFTLLSAPDASEEQVTSFTGAIGLTCTDSRWRPSDRIVGVATVVYELEDAYKPASR